jgi:hypothetical protein
MSQSRPPIRQARRDALVIALRLRSPRRLDGREYRRWHLYCWRRAGLDRAVNDAVQDGLATIEIRGPSIYVHLREHAAEDGAA